MWRTRSQKERDKGLPRAGSPAPALRARPQRLLEMQTAAGNDVVNRVVHGHIQTKLVVGSADDPAERQADRVAEAVLRSLTGHDGVGGGSELEEGSRISRKASRSTDPLGGMDVDPENEAAIAQARSRGSALDPGVRTRMETAFGSDFGAVRIHRGREADHLSRSLQARAFTTGADIFFASGAYQPGTSSGQALLAHELTHVVQQGAAGPHRAGPLLQRYTEVQPGQATYPTKWEYSRFFRDQPAAMEAQYFTRQEKHGEGFYAPGDVPRPNLVHTSNAALLVSDNLDLAIESTTGEAKHFFADTTRFKEANAALQGKVYLEQTNRYLWIDTPGRKEKLFEVQPVVGDGKQHGLDVRTPQRCNEMAEFVSGKYGLEFGATMQANELIADVLTRATGVDWNARRREKARFSTHEEVKAYGAFLDIMVVEFQRCLKDDDISVQMEAALNDLLTNRRLDPELGSAITTVGLSTTEQEKQAKAEGQDFFLYHFATVVAKSGQDFVTMENYARRDKRITTTLSAGDPLFFFKMYGRAEAGQTWHQQQLATGNFQGAVVSFQVR
jgi:Domain of unknown function (DUF4157)